MIASRQLHMITNHRTLPRQILDQLHIQDPWTVETVYDAQLGWRIAVVTDKGNHLIICDEKLGIVTVYR